MSLSCAQAAQARVLRENHALQIGGDIALRSLDVIEGDHDFPNLLETKTRLRAYILYVITICLAAGAGNGKIPGAPNICA